MLYREVWLTPLITLLCLYRCLGKPTIGISERRKQLHITEFKKKVLQHHKYNRPPNINRFNLTDLDQLKLNKLIARMNKNNAGHDMGTTILKNTDCIFKHNIHKDESSRVASFHLPPSSSYRGYSVVSAELSFPEIYLNSISEYHNLYYVNHSGSNSSTTELVNVDRTVTKGDRLKFDVSTYMKNKLVGEDFSFLLSTARVDLIKVDDLNCFPKDSAMLTLKTRSKLSRRKRALDPVDCKKSDQEKRCCRYSVHISFKKIGWDDWVLAPQGYDAHYCAGSCPHRYKMAHTFAGIKSMLHLINPSLAPKPHCTATKLSPLTLIHFNEDGEMTYTDYPDMIVQECKCS